MTIIGLKKLKVISVETSYNPKLARKFNSIINFIIKNDLDVILEIGGYTSKIKDIDFRELWIGSSEMIILDDNGNLYNIGRSSDVKIDRKFGAIVLNPKYK